MKERQPRSRQDRASLQHQAEHTRPRRSPLGGYLIVLFAVAFLLLLMAYFQQQRQSAQAATDALKQSSSAVESIQNLMDESAKLRDENSALKEQVEELEKELAEAIASAVSAEEDEEAQARMVAAMDWFWQIDEAYVRGRYTLCRELIQGLQDAGLDDDLPTRKAFDNDRFSPAERYKEIYDALY